MVINRGFSLMVALTALGVTALSAAAQTDIRETPGGPRLLFVDGDDIRPEPGGKRLLFVDGDDIRPEPGGKRLLFVDGDDVRPEPGGLRLLFIDGQDIRREPGGPRLLFIDGDDIRPEPGGKRLYFIDGPELSREQLVAVLYTLKPDLFKLSAEEEKAQIQARAEVAAQEEAAANQDPLPGTYSILTFYSSEDVKRSGKIEVSARGEFYGLSLAFDGQEAWQGVGVRHGDELWVAIGPPESVALAVYSIDKGTLDGRWYPWYATGQDPSLTGTEKLSGSETLGGGYTITQAVAPGADQAYGGTVSLTPVDGPMDGNVLPFTARWTIGEYVVNGVALRIGDHLIAASGTKPQFEVAHLKIGSDGTLTGDFFSSAKAKGYYTTMKE